MHILLVSRHFPPEISGGARRPLLYMQGLRMLGHKVTLVTPFTQDDPDSICVPNRAIDNGMAQSQRPLEAISGGGHIIGSKLKSFARDWVYWPDHNIVWARSVIKHLRDRDMSPDVVFTTSPPESIHLIGREISKAWSVPWIAEFRDTWVEMPHRDILVRSSLRRVVERHIARRTLKSAHALTAVSESVMREARKYVRSGTPEIIIGHFSDTQAAPYNFDQETLNIVHTGGFSLSDRRRDLTKLLSELDVVFGARPNMVFHIAGPLTPHEHEAIAAAATPVKAHGHVSREMAKSMQSGADGLILCTPGNSHALPGKYAEYCMAGRPIFYTGGGEWLSLVKDKSGLNELAAGLPALQKGDGGRSQASLNHIAASQTLASFIQSQL